MATISTTREHLLEVGLRQLRTTGYTATGVKEVLDLAHVPKGSFYHYFSSKEAFVSELFDRYAKGEGERAQRVLGDTSIAPLERLRTYFEELISIYGEPGEGAGCLVGAMSLEIADHIPKLQAQLQSMYAGWQHGIADVLRQAIKRGDLAKSTKPDALAEFILNSYEGALVRMKAEQDSSPLRNFQHFIFDIVLKK
ncbi:TetR/AcrR family transcriptional regulator [Granulicella tundricola]|uniref:Transcriptional regulator, TetR family n=1 Tax=Granulicella tundricola (strain ATCC BAA-1859 / DSM 23138 / MP5ACTX9) TaxID=1198114 RepID=E8WYX0_GRATM|nr:TetR/AcrR family transcriptional regulator [Granulicella tundricola]ADW68806.1 transcriptional regulator, TetR family [Granulicella tundricola MP5ACTX9]